MESVNLVCPVTLSNFDEAAYLAVNPDVRSVVRAGRFRDGREHFERHGVREKRFQLSGGMQEEWKREKFAYVEAHCRPELSYVRSEGVLDFLQPDSTGSVDAEAWQETKVSDWGYDRRLGELIARHADGWILDCGAGWRKRYYRRIINVEIERYPSTDVLASADNLPFQDNIFDLVISSSVLEHVRDPFACAAELARVLKPGGTLFCSVPFLQPYHGYPDHYYNMTAEGVKNLFRGQLVPEETLVYGTLRPISALCWILQSWADGLKGEDRATFLKMRVEDFLQGRDAWMETPFVAALSAEKNLELAAGTVLIARKPEDQA